MHSSMCVCASACTRVHMCELKCGLYYSGLGCGLISTTIVATQREGQESGSCSILKVGCLSLSSVYVQIPSREGTINGIDE